MVVESRNLLPSLVVRPAQLADARDLHILCWPDRSLESVVALLKRTQYLAFNRRGLGVVALRENRPCGFGLLTLWTRVAEISDLIVGPHQRGQGIGSSIIAYLTQTARRLNAEAVEIGVALSNPRALALYRRLGFTEDRAVALDLGRGSETVLYLIRRLSTT